MLSTLSNQEKGINYKKLDFRREKTLNFDFRYYRILKKLLRYIYYKNFSIKEAERKQDEFELILTLLEEYNPREPE